MQNVMFLKGFLCLMNVQNAVINLTIKRSIVKTEEKKINVSVVQTVSNSFIKFM